MSDIYFAKAGATKKDENLLNRIKTLYDKAGFGSIISENEYVAVKLHFGELGNTTSIRPIFVRQVVDKIIDSGGKPFLTDSNTLYVGERSNAVDHLNCAQMHGFLPSSVNAPVIIADGLTGRDYIEVDVNLKNLKTVKYGTAAYYAPVIVGVTHFKGHLATGFGGSLKNIGMGLGSRAGKQVMHSDIKPKVNIEVCEACGTCMKWCPADAISFVDGKANIDHNICIGCSECVISCEPKAISIRFDASKLKLQEKVVEYAYGVLKDKKKKCFFFNFLYDITPDCDCLPWSGAPIVHDIGVLASKDPVAIDQASADLVNEQRGNPESRLKKALEPGDDKFYDIHEIKWSHQLEYAEEIGLGSRTYKIKEI